MEVQNHTPFPGLVYEGLDPLDQCFHVAALRIAYDLKAEGAESFTHQLTLRDEPSPLAVEDAFYGEPNTSSPKWESDLVPHKPQCDVVLLGEGHSPSGKPTGSFPIALALSGPDRPMSLPLPPQGLNPFMAPSPEEVAQYEALVTQQRGQVVAGAPVLECRLTLHGPRTFRKRNGLLRLFWGLLRLCSLGIIHRNPWKLTPPGRITSLPIRYEHAYGGACRVDADDEKAAKRIPKKHRLPPQAALPGAPASVAHTICPTNPLGRGFLEPWFVKARRLKATAAPQIEPEAHPITAKLLWRAMRGKKDAMEHPALKPAGMGAIGRSWQPRLALAGTPDAQWLQDRHPLLPKDFDLAYWNCAHPTLRCRHPEGGEVFTLTNLLPHDSPGTTRDLEGNTLARFKLPEHQPFLLARFESGMMGTIPMKTDSLILDLEAMQVIRVFRATVMKTQPLRALELRMDEHRAEPQTDAEESHA